MKSAIITATVLISVLLNRIPSSPLRKKGGKRKKREIKFPRELEEVTDKKYETSSRPWLWESFRDFTGEGGGKKKKKETKEREREREGTT